MVKSAKITEPANHIAVFQESSTRRVWHNEEWWFSVVDVCAILTASPDACVYWRKHKQRLNAEGGQPVTFCHGLKLQAPDGKQRETYFGWLQLDHGPARISQVRQRTGICSGAD